MVNIGSKESWKNALSLTTVFLLASIWGHIIGTSSAFVKMRIELCFTDGNIWLSKISNVEGGQIWPSKFLTLGQH